MLCSLLISETPTAQTFILYADTLRHRKEYKMAIKYYEKGIFVLTKGLKIAIRSSGLRQLRVALLTAVFRQESITKSKIGFFIFDAAFRKQDAKRQVFHQSCQNI